jgi:uncharacterized membrane protein YgcG
MYFVLIIDISVFSTRVSAFVLICSRVMSEVALFIFGLIFVIIAFSCALSALDHEDADFAGLHKASVGLVEIALAMYPNSHYELLHHEPALLVGVIMYVVVAMVFLTNVLIAQLNCAYQATYLDMVGYARLNRGKVVVESMVWVKQDRWSRFLETLRLDERVEFGEGDIGLAGGVQVLELASANITTIDMIRRFGGSTSPAAQWPQDDLDNNDEDDKFERLEKMIEKAMKRMTSTSGKKGGSSGAGGSTNISSDNKESGSGDSVHSMGE